MADRVRPYVRWDTKGDLESIPVMQCLPEAWKCGRCGGGMSFTDRFGSGVEVLCTHVCPPRAIDTELGKGKA